MVALTVLLAGRWTTAAEGPCQEAVGGFAEERLADWASAPGAFEGLPDDLSAFLSANRALRAGRFTEAASAFEAAIKVPSSPVAHLARLALPEVLLRACRARDAEAAASDVLKRFPDLPWRGRVLELRAAARARLRDAKGVARDLAAGPPGPTTEAARRAFRAGQWESAIALYRALRAGPRGASLEREALASEGRSLFRLGRMKEANEAYLAAWKRHGSRSGLSWALKTAFMSGDHRLGLELTTTALATAGDRAATRLRLVEYLVTFGHYDEALRLYLAHLRERDRVRRPPPRTNDELWTLGWLLYRTGRLERALAALEAGRERSARADDRQRVTYWLGRVHEASRDRGRATRDYEAVLTGPDRYYRLLASSRRLALRADALLLVEGEGVVVDRLLGGARLSAPVPDFERLAALPRVIDEAIADGGTAPDLPEARAARYLLEHGLRAGARDYLRVLVNRSRALRQGGAQALAGFPVLPVTDYRGPTVGHWGEVLRAEAGPRRERKAWLADQAAVRAIGKAGRDLVPRLVPLLARAGDEALALRYLASWRALPTTSAPSVPTPESPALPLAYREHVLAAARAESVDPFLLWAIAQRESAFDERVVSPAGAMGLFQVMPETGARLAALLEPGSGPFDPTRLYEPATAVRYGARYLRLLLDRFLGQEPLAIAAYNAGPNYLAAWVQQKPSTPLDAFVEEIPFDENRAYVKRVLASWMAYREHYGFDGELFLGNRLDARVSEGVSF